MHQICPDPEDDPQSWIKISRLQCESLDNLVCQFSTNKCWDLQPNKSRSACEFCYVAHFGQSVYEVFDPEKNNKSEYKKYIKHVLVSS